MNQFTLSRRPHTRKRRAAARLELELLEVRNLLDGGLTNVLVNDPLLDTTAQDTQSETAIVLGTGSKVIVAYNSARDISADDFLGTGYARSVNGGATFKDQGSLPYQNLGDPVLARSARTGTIFLSALGLDSASVNPNPPPPFILSGRERVDVSRSTNNGTSFGQPVNGTPGHIAGVDNMDKPWMAVDNFPGAGYGNVYLVTSHASASPTIKRDILFTRSTDDGLTWGPSGGTVITSPDEPYFAGAYVTVGPDHAVYVLWWDDTEAGSNTRKAEILMRKSTDQGVTFSDPVTVTTLRTPYLLGDLFLTDSNGNYSFRTDAFPRAAVNPVTGDIYVAFNDWGNASGEDKGNIYLTQSTNGGERWSKPVQVNDDHTHNDQWFPALAVTPNGRYVGLFWYDRRLDPADWSIDRFGAIGTVSRHTVTFGANFRITDQSFPPVFGQDPVAPPTYMGDYDQATADNDFFYTTWGDNRLANPNYPAHAHQPDVRLAKILITSSGGGSALVAANMPTTIAPRARSQSLGQHNVQPLLTVALAYWANTGIDVSSLQGINVRITNLGGRTLGLANGDTIWLDDDAAGRGWFVDPTPWDESEITKPGDQGEQHRMDLLTVLEHEIGHLLGYEHEANGVMAETLDAGTRPGANTDRALDVPFVSSDPLWALLALDEDVPALRIQRKKK